MKVTFSTSVANDLTKSSLSTRVLTQNLMENDKIDVSFSNAPILISYKTSQEIKEMELSNRVKTYKPNFRTMMMMLLTQNYKEDFLNSIKGDYLLYSMCCGAFDYELIAYLLNQGVRIVLGGTEISMSKFDDIKKKLLFCGAKNLDNVIFVNGFVKTYTDLHEIIKKWENVYLDRRDLNNILHARKDYTRNNPIGRILKKIDYKTHAWPSMAFVIFNSICHWNKCTFCRYDEINVNLIRKQEVDDIFYLFMKMYNNLDVDYIAFGDSYFYLDENRIELLKKLKAEGVKLYCQTGIRLLKDREYARNICRYFDIVSIGVETFTDFGLKQFNKGFTWNDIKTTFDYMKDYGQNTMFIVNQLIDAPCSDEDNVRLNYKRMIELKQYMESYGVKFLYSPRMLSMLTQRILDAFVQLGHVRIPQENSVSGRYVIWEELEKVKDVSQVYRLDGFPYERIDSNGKLVKSDIDIIDDETFFKVVKGWL